MLQSKINRSIIMIVDDIGKLIEDILEAEKSAENLLIQTKEKEIASIEKDTIEKISALKQSANQEIEKAVKTKLGDAESLSTDVKSSIKVDKKKQDEAIKYVLAQFNGRWGK